jgi:beta-ureidopropionase / N-carbamoyl-L-amino-acid hydrolase
MVSSERIQDNLRQLASIGATPEGGATRLAWSPEERQAHELAKQWMREAGLRVWEDPLGNTFGQREGQDKSLPTIMIGSHLDTVNNGGNLDGTLGFVAAMETIRSLNEDGVTTRHPITVSVFAAEEAVRFADTCMGSKLITNQMERAELDKLKDAQGVTPAQAMREIGLDPDRIDEVRWDPASIAAYLEIHIEQGMVLEGLGKKVGVVTAIAAATRYKVILEGSADHSGATPMGARKDALAAAAEIVLGVERIATEEAGPTTVGTVGILKVKPGAMTVIPGWAELGIDIRDTVPEDKRAASEKTEAMIRAVSERRNIGLTLEQLIDHMPAKMDETVQDAMRNSCRKLGYDCHSMPSAAGHDARIMAFATRAGLLFVPSRGGISHSPKEYTAPEDVLAGIEVLSEATRLVDESL